MNKNFSRFLTALFCVFLAGITVVSLILPKQSFSPQENRYLQSAPVLSWKNVKSGKFMSQAEDWTADHIAGRDYWVTLRARCETLLGKKENNGVYFGTDGETLFAQYTAPADLEERVGYINAMADKLSVPVYFSLVPDKSYVYADLLPEGAPLRDDGSASVAAAGLCSDRIAFIDLYAAQWGDDSFYRTDHHWTTMGAYTGYLTLSQAMNGSSTLMENEPKLESDQFFGTTWSSSGATWVRPDSIYTWVSDKLGFQVTAYPDGKPVEGQLYVREKLEVKDKYAMFLGGNQPLCVIENPNGTKGKLLVIRDSYSDSLAPFLAQDYGEVHLFDLRYNLTPISQYVEENGIDQVLVLYSASNFATDANLRLIAR